MHTIKLHIESAKHIGYKSRALAVASSGARPVSIAKAVNNSATLSILLREFNHDLVQIFCSSLVIFLLSQRERI